MAAQDEAGTRMAILYSLTYGGGLIGGDRIELSLDVKPGAKLILLTQVRNNAIPHEISDSTLSLVGVHQSVSVQAGSTAFLRARSILGNTEHSTTHGCACCRKRFPGTTT